jgi:hypothetical protein
MKVIKLCFFSHWFIHPPIKQIPISIHVLVRKEMNVKEQYRLSNITLKHLLARKEMDVNEQ